MKTINNEIFKTECLTDSENETIEGVSDIKSVIERSRKQRQEMESNFSTNSVRKWVKRIALPTSRVLRQKQP